jgi:hypothetical protein
MARLALADSHADASTLTDARKEKSSGNIRTVASASYARKPRSYYFYTIPLPVSSMIRNITPLNILGIYYILKVLYLIIAPLFGIGYSPQGFEVLALLILFVFGLVCFAMAWSVRKWVKGYLKIFLVELTIFAILYIIDTLL